MTLPKNFRAWGEIDASALAHNIDLLQKRFGRRGQTRVMAVVKADAYGHGVDLIAPLCARHGLRDFGVATTDEGVRLRLLLPEAAIYLLGPALLSEAPTLVEHGLIPLLSSLELGQALSQAAQAQGTVAEVHLDVDTGIGRAGVQVSDALAVLETLDALPGLRVSGLSTHFASADEDLVDVHGQWTQFAEFLTFLGDRVHFLLIHAANSPAALVLPPEARHTLVRPGLLLYGIAPAPGMLTQADLKFRPVLSLRTRVTLCRALPAGATISYGRTYTVPSGGGVYATLGIGYGDGYPRRLSPGGYVLLHGRRAPICGRVCMDQTVVDVSHILGVQNGDVATLLGADGGETLTAGDLAAQIETTPHEITTCLTARVPRLTR